MTDEFLDKYEGEDTETEEAKEDSNPFKLLDFDAEIKQEALPVVEEEIEEEIPEEPDKPANPYASANTQADMYKLFNDIYLEAFDIEYALTKSSEDFSSKLVEKGIKANPDNLYSTVDYINTRLLRVSVIKRLCMAYGLHCEYKDILAHELELLYNSTRPLTKSPLTTVTKATGE